jgi:surface carbohydrate biosynthesis protein (TIGR04326 family)
LKNEVVLFLDYSRDFSIEMLKFIEKYDRLYNREFNYLIKPHINAPINLKNFRIKNANIATDNIDQILKRSHTAICSNMTSAQIDALMMGLNVIVLLDGKELNLSPLRKQKGVNFAKTPKELDQILYTKRNEEHQCLDNDFFFNDLKLKRWQKLVKV